ncbi:hypothetical protein RND71_000796 [Anisodus tanguticus]|uniref:PB1-like domain-containing protein n=1 Tax=Anisodus tanguticus TaxID=243964 RepID=A0AAE1SZM9_9SOLA|nr:hypothetical protein RND71_000796 [Anisodus tanguticus]
MVRLVVNFHYGGEWIKVPKLVYSRKFVHTWEGYDSDLLYFLDLVDQFKNLGFIGVQQLVVTGPSGKYYELEFDTEIRTLLYLVSDGFCVINLFVVDEFELGIDVTNIVHHFESYCIDVEVGTDYDRANETLNSSFSDSSDDDFDKSKGKQAVVKRFKGSSNSTIIVLESEDNFPSSSITITVLEPVPSLRPMSFSEVNTRILERIKQTLATPTRRISFVGDFTRMSQPTNMPYQPPNMIDVTWNKLRVTREKMKTRKGNGKSQT